MKKAGFTLIEVLIVVVIIAILAAVAIPIYNKTIAGAQEKEARANLESIYNAQRMYRMDFGGYYQGTAPDDFSGLEAYIDNPNYRSESYTYNLNAAGDTFTATAAQTGRPTLTIDETGTIQ